MTREAGGFGAFLVGVLAIFGMLVSFLSLYEHIAIEIGPQVGMEMGTGLCKLGEGFNCRAVIGSKWSVLFGLPIASYGLLFYLVLLLLSVLSLDGWPLTRQKFFEVAFAFSVLACGYSLYLFIISKFFIGALCPICLATYCINALLLLVTAVFGSGPIGGRFVAGALAIIRSPAALAGGSEASAQRTAAVSRLVLFTIGIGAAAVLFLPSFVLNEAIGRQVQARRSAQSAHAALEEWKAAEVQDMQIIDGDPLKGSFSRGESGAPITIVEYSDFECPACRAVNDIMKDLFAEYAAHIKFVHRDYPLDKACNPFVPQEFHRSACLAAEFARCAGEQGKFWEATDFLYQLEALESGESPNEVRNELLNAAPMLGIDRAGIEECLASGRQRSVIVEDINAGDRYGVEGTPSFWINGRKVQAISPDGFRAIFDYILSSNNRR